LEGITLYNTILTTKILMNSTTNFNIDAGDSISIVGSSGTLLDNKYGSIINSSSDTLRFNHASTINYEEYSGNKTTIRIVNIHHLLNLNSESYYTKFSKRFPNIDRFFLNSLENEKIIFKILASQWDPNFTNIINNLAKKNSISFMNSEVANLAIKLCGAEPSCGLFGLFLALKYFKTIKCFGFDFHQSKLKPKHYYENVENISGGYHNYTNEQQIFYNLEKNNHIKLYK